MTNFKTLTRTLSIVTIAGIMGVTVAHAQPTMADEGMKCDMKKEMMENHKGKHHNKGKHGNMRAIMEQLNLTDAQKTALKENRKAQREVMKAKRTEMKGTHIRGQFITAEGVDRAGMIAKATERATTRANIKADMMEKTLSILTAEQRVKFVELLKADTK